jgi:hypothetical protein
MTSAVVSNTNNVTRVFLEINKAEVDVKIRNIPDYKKPRRIKMSKQEAYALYKLLRKEFKDEN